MDGCWAREKQALNLRRQIDDFYDFYFFSDFYVMFLFSVAVGVLTEATGLTLGLHEEEEVALADGADDVADHGTTQNEGK